MSTRKAHKYSTAFIEIERVGTSRGHGSARVARLLRFTPGKDKGAFTELVAELEKRDVPPSQVTGIAVDMSTALIAGTGEHFPEALSFSTATTS